MKVNHNTTAKERRVRRIRMKVRGTAERPRLHVFRSNQHFYIQAIDDQSGRTVASANDLQPTMRKVVEGKKKSDVALLVMETIAEKLTKAKIKRIVFDRGAYRYHGKVMSVAEGLRAKGFEF